MLATAIDLLLQEYRTRPMARFAAWTIAFGLALGLTSIIAGGVPAGLWILLVIALAITTVYYIGRVVGALKHHVLWHFRRRLIVTYVFIAVVPVVLILVLGGLATVMLNGQFAAFLVALRVHDQVEELRQVNRVVAHEAHLSEVKTAKELIEQLHRFYVQELSTHSASYPDLEIALSIGSEKRAFYLDGKPLPKFPAIPPWLRMEEFAGVVSDGGRIYLRSVDRGETPAGPITMVLSEPFSPKLLDIVGSGIGPVGIVFNPEEQGMPAPAIPGNGAGELPRRPRPRATTLQSKSIILPPPVNFLDADVFGTSTLNPIRWAGTTEKRVAGPVFVYVTSRLSTLTGRLLGTLGRYSRIYVALFLVVAAIFLFIELMSLLVGIRLTRTVTSAMDKLYDATERVKAGDLSYRINMPADDQLSSLGEAFDNMTAALRRLMREAHEKAVLERDLQIAREVQQQLFPTRIPEVAGLKLYGACRPARGVSGDYYDFLPIGKDRLGIVLGDVSGKGVSAALIMSAVQSIIRTRFYADSSSEGRFDSASLSTADFFGKLNQQMFENTPAEKYATCFYALYDADARRMVYTNAGHPAPLLFRNGATVKLDVGGTPLGLIAPMIYHQAELTLESGDILVAFSDGLTEAENSFEEEFGEQRLIETIQRAQDYSLEDMVNEIYRSIEDWTGGNEPQDDMTLIVARASS
ncbi:MAG: SpoIIE family protein phosphatase [Acidobacteria bacterium]|nr:SpoIIE family protein phosphatase [Acidobacteriota bacterium]